MATLYIGIILLCRVAQALFNKRSSLEVTSAFMTVRYTAFRNVISAVLGLLLILVAGNGFYCDWMTVALSAFSGISLFVAGVCSLYAMKSGTVSLDSMFGTAGMLVPLIAGIVLFDEQINLIQWLACGLFFVAAWLLIGSSRQICPNFSWKTILILMASMVANGGTMLAQQMFTAYVPNGDVSVFSFLSFGIIGVLGYLMLPFMKKGRKADTSGEKKGFSRALIICGVVLAIAVFVINQLATLSTALVPPVILFTFINGGATIISAIVAATVYGEKLTVRSCAGVVLGVLSLVLIKMFS